MEGFPKSNRLVFSSESSQPQLLFFQDLMKNLMDQRNTGQLCDVVVRVREERLHCHRSILGANSPYFYSMFTSDFGEKESKEINLTASFTSASALKAILDFMYTGYLMLDEDILEEVLNGGTLFLMDSVRGHCAHYMLANLGMHNVLLTWELAERYSLNSLGRVCKSVATEHLQDCLFWTTDYSSFSPTVIEIILKVDSLPSSELMRFLSNWMESDVSRREILKSVLGRNHDKVECVDSLMKLVESDTNQITLKEATHELNKTSNKTVATAEYIVFHKVESVASGQSVVKLFAHSGKMKAKWICLTEIKCDPTVATSITHIIGFLGHKVVFGSVDGGKVKLIDLDTSETSTVSLLEEDGINDIRRTILYSCFCFDNRLFCIEKNKDNYFFSCAYTLKQYNPALGMWSQVSELPLTDMEQRDEVEFQVVVLRDEVLILASLYGYPYPMLNQRAFYICFLVRKSPGNYDIIHCASHTTIVHGTMENTSFVITERRDPQENENFVLLQASRSDLEYPGLPVEFKLSSSILYNASTTEWKQFMPTSSKLCLPIPEEKVPLRFNERIQCSSVVTAGEGCIYQTRTVCPYISELWVLQLSQNEDLQWQKLCCCPADLRSARITVCHVPPSLQEKCQPATFQDPGKDCAVGPMLMYRLPDVSSRIHQADEPDVHVYDIDRCYGQTGCRVDSDSESECGIIGRAIPSGFNKYIADTESDSDTDFDVQVNHVVVVGGNISDSD